MMPALFYINVNSMNLSNDYQCINSPSKIEGDIGGV